MSLRTSGRLSKPVMDNPKSAADLQEKQRASEYPRVFDT
jgi:hypothetical protein